MACIFKHCKFLISNYLISKKIPNSQNTIGASLGQLEQLD